MKKSASRLTFRDYEPFIKGLMTVNFQTAAIIGAELIGQALKEILEEALPSVEAGEKDQLDDLRLDQKMNLARRLNIIDKDYYDVIKYVKKIRDECAHGTTLIKPKLPLVIDNMIDMLTACPLVQHSFKGIDFADWKRRELYVAVIFMICNHLTTTKATNKFKYEWTFTDEGWEDIRKYVFKKN